MADDVATASTPESPPPLLPTKKSICKLCGKRFGSPQLLGAHKRYAHPHGPHQGHTTHAKKTLGKASFKCPECKRVFNSPGTLGTHRRSVHGVLGSSHESIRRQRQAARGPGLMCPECGKVYSFASGLGSHRQKVHGVAGTSDVAIAKQRLKLERIGRNGNSASSPHEEIDGFTLGHACASIQALIAHTAERDGVPAELLTSRIVDFLQASPLRKRGRPRSSL